jgi:hypothetical protein
MATDIVQTLFGITPEGYQRQQAAEADRRALAIAQLNPMQRAEFNIGRGAYQLAGALGGTDPELARISLRQSVARDIDYTNPESVQAGIQRLAPLDPQGAMMLNQEYRKALESGALVRQREAAAQASEAAAKRERQPPAEILKAQEIARLKQQRNFLSMDTRDETGQRDQQLELLDAQIAALEQRKPIVVGNALVTEAGKVIYTGEPKLPSVGEAREAVSLERFDKPFAQLNQSQRAQVNAVINTEAVTRAQAGAAVSPIAVVGPSGAPMFVSRAQAMGMTPAAEARQFLPPSLQKDESKDLELVDSLAMRRESLKEPLTLLTPDPVTKKPPLELGPIKNAQYLAQNASGNSTPESRAYAALQRAVQEATNLKTDAAKGVQTDKDVLRFANELIAAFGKNDTKTTLEALTKFNKATQSALEQTQVRIDARRKGQGVAPFYGTSTAPKGTPGNPIKLED